MQRDQRPLPPAAQHGAHRDRRPDRPRDVQRRHRGVDVGTGHLDRPDVERVEHRDRVDVTGQQPGRGHRVEPVDDERDAARDEQRVAMPQVDVGPPGEQRRQHQPGHQDVRDDVVVGREALDPPDARHPVVERRGGVAGGVDPPLPHGVTVLEGDRAGVGPEVPGGVVQVVERGNQDELRPPARPTPASHQQVGQPPAPRRLWSIHPSHPVVRYRRSKILPHRRPLAQQQGRDGEARPQIRTPRCARNGIGSTLTPLTRTSKCRWAPVASPAAPTRAMTSPACTGPEVRT